MTRHPVVIRDVVVLGEESAAGREHTNDLPQAISPVRNVVQDREVENCIELAVRRAQRCDVARRDRNAIAVCPQTAPCPVNHCRVEIDGRDARGTEQVELTRHALPGSTTHVQPRKALRSSAELDESGDDTLTESLGTKPAPDVRGLRSVHAHRTIYDAGQAQARAYGRCEAARGGCRRARRRHQPRRRVQILGRSQEFHLSTTSRPNAVEMRATARTLTFLRVRDEFSSRARSEGATACNLFEGASRASA
jgi:hypothetical protein